MNSKFFKTQADDALAVNGRNSTFVKIVVIGSIIGTAFNTPNFLSESVPFFTTMAGVAVLSLISVIYGLVFSPIYSYALGNASLKVLRNEDIAISDLWSGLAVVTPLIIFNLISTIFIVLGFVCFIVPGIMLTYSYAMGYLIIAENPGISGKEAMDKSKELMKGYRFELFKLDFSFVGWYILSIFTLGILILWIEPKHQTARAAFYRKLKEIKYGEEDLDNSIVNNTDTEYGYEPQPFTLVESEEAEGISE